MSKELTPLQALEKLVDRLAIKKYDENGNLIYWQSTTDNEYPIIKTAIKENETLKECYENELKNTAYYNNLALKYKKAVEIIKEHLLDIDWFLQFVTQNISYQHYVYCIEQSNNAFAKRFLLNKEEYDLLKEILL